MKLYRIYLPKKYNDSTIIPSQLIAKITEQIHEKFGGYTLDPFGRLPIMQGIWKSPQDIIYQDEINVVEIFVEDTLDIKKWFRANQELWRQELKQDKLFIIVQDADVLDE